MSTIPQSDSLFNGDLWIDQFWDGKERPPNPKRIVYAFLIQKEAERLIWRDNDLEEIWLTESDINESTESALRRPGNPILCRPDMLSAHVELTRHNAQVLSNLSTALFECIMRHGLQGYTGPDLKTTFKISKRKREWQITIKTSITKIQVIGRTALWSPTEDYKTEWRTHFSFPAEREQKFLFQDDRGKWPPEELMRICFPKWEQIWAAENSGIRFCSLAEIRITNTRKVFYREYLMDILDTLDVLESFLTLEPWKLEIALDCIDESKALALRQFAYLKWDDCRHVFHFNKGSSRLISSPVSGGESEYTRLRPKGRQDSRPNSQRPKQGTRQLHTYSRKQNWGELHWNLYRLEVKFYRDYLRRFMRATGMKYVRDLIFCIPYLALSHLSFKQLDTKVFFREFKLSWSLQKVLKRLNIRGQIYTLLQAQQDKRLFLPFDPIKPYIKNLNRPDILFLRHPWLDPVCDKINGLELVP